MRDLTPRPDEIPYYPNQGKQLVFLAILLTILIVTSVVILLLWPLDARDFRNIAVRMIVHNLRGLLIVVCAVLAVFSAVCVPILGVQILLHRPAFTLTPAGIRLKNGVVIAWDEIDEIHEYVVRSAPGPIQHVVIGLFLLDEDATRQRLGAVGRWQMNANKKQGLPPLVLTTHHLSASAPEILDEIEDFVADMKERAATNERWPKVYRRKD